MVGALVLGDTVLGAYVKPATVGVLVLGSSEGAAVLGIPVGADVEGVAVLGRSLVGVVVLGCAVEGL